MFNPEPRIGWLLRTCRLAGLPGVSARRFADLLAAEGVTADASRVSRWETGQVPAPYQVIEAYERLVDLIPAGLRGVAAYQRRVGTRRVAEPGALSPARVSPGWLERILDAVVDGAPDARTWLEFGMGAAVTGEQLVLPRSMWRVLATRLVSQTAVAVGTAYLGRSEAGVLLTTHPSARRALLQAVGEIVTEPDVPVTSDPMSVLQEVPGEQANELVLRLLQEEPAVTRNAAARVAATKVGRGHFDGQAMARLEEVAGRLARRHGLDRDGSFAGLVDLVEMLPGRTERLAVEQAPQPAPDEVAGLVAEVVSRAGGPDPMLQRLATLMLADRRIEHRFLAIFTLQQSPFRAEVAAAAAAAVEAHVEGRHVLDDELVHRLMIVLTVVADAPEAGLLLRLAEHPGARVQRLALAAVGHLPPGAGVRRPRLEPLLTGADDAVAGSATYCAGMTGDPVLRRVVDHPAVPEARRRAAQWWVAHGPALHEPGVIPRTGRS